MTHSTNSTTLGDLLERILDKGVVVAGDIRIKIVDIELLTIEIRLLICSVDRAEQIGMDWWRNEGKFPGSAREDAVTRLDTRLDRLEALLMEGRERPIVRPDDE
ncbi:gas vesicle protein [Marivita lacus]|nr:gas vesicle protein [Marivita lacus]